MMGGDFLAYQMTILENRIDGRRLFQKKIDGAGTFPRKIDGAEAFPENRFGGAEHFLKKIWRGRNFFGQKKLCPAPVPVSFAPSLKH